MAVFSGYFSAETLRLWHTLVLGSVRVRGIRLGQHSRCPSLMLLPPLATWCKRGPSAPGCRGAFVPQLQRPVLELVAGASPLSRRPPPLGPHLRPSLPHRSP